MIRQLFILIRDVSDGGHPRHHNMIADLTEVLFLLLHDYRIQNGAEPHNMTPHEELFSRFQQAIREHYAEPREVRYYAQLLGLSTKYFSSVIMSLTDTRPIDWINGYVMVQAKLLLDSQSELSIQHIGQKLGFTHQAAFSRFFKAYAHVTPTEYRERSTDSCNNESRP